MELKAYSIRDSKGEIYHNPFFKHTHGEAERDFTTAVNDDKSTLHQFPDDFDLYHIGSYDNQTGVFKALATPQHIQKAVHVKRPANA